MADDTTPTPPPERAPGSGTKWHGSEEPPAPWQRNTDTNWGAPGGNTPGEASGQNQPPPPRKQNTGNRKRRSIFAILAIAIIGFLIGLAIAYALNFGGSDAGEQQSQQSQAERSQTQPGPVDQTGATAPNWVATAEAVAPSVVAITINAYQGTAQGSGVILDAEGHVVTNHHVIAPAVAGQAEISVTLNDNRSYTARVVGSDPSTDLAVLSVDAAPNDLRPISLGDSDALRVGEPVMAIGNPLGLSGTVTEGIVSALDRPLITSGEGGDPLSGVISEDIVTNAVQTSAAINPGNSGGALVNPSGQLIGINSSIASTSQDGGNIGIGFAIPVNAMKNVVGQLMTTGSVDHSYLGVSATTGTVPEGSAQRAAAIVAGVEPGSPAAEADIRRGDAIVAMNGEPIDSSAALVAQVRDHPVGTTVTVTIVRGGERQDVQVTLGSRPTAQPTG